MSGKVSIRSSAPGLISKLRLDKYTKPFQILLNEEKYLIKPIGEVNTVNDK